jgi:secreted trypsin-like serine protease
MSTILLGQACTKKDDSSAKVLQNVTCENGRAVAVGIFGGEVLSSESILAKGLVLIYKSMGPGAGTFCTGSLIDSNIILTAAHCVLPSGEDPKKVSVYWSVDPLCSVIQNGDESLVRDAEQIIVNPSYGNALSSDHGDIALIRISGSAPTEAIPAPLIDRSVTLNSDSKILVAGYGKTTDYTKDDSAKQLMRVTLVKPFQGNSYPSKDFPEKATRNLSRERLVFDQTDGHGACAGDSGGPSMLKANGVWSIMGVASYIDPLQDNEFKNKESTCRVGIVYTSVVYFKDWIQRSYLELRNEKTTNGLRWVYPTN